MGDRSACCTGSFVGPCLLRWLLVWRLQWLLSLLAGVLGWRRFELPVVEVAVAVAVPALADAVACWRWKRRNKTQGLRFAPLSLHRHQTWEPQTMVGMVPSSHHFWPGYAPFFRATGPDLRLNPNRAEWSKHVMYS